MTMTGKGIVAALVAAAGLLMATASARAGDTVRLDLKKGDAVTTKLNFDGKDVGTFDVHSGHRYHHHYGFYGSFYGGYYPRFYGYYPRYYYPAFSFSIYRPVYYYPRSVVIYSDPFLCPIGGNTLSTPPATNLRNGPGSGGADETLPPPRPAPADGTFPYDGGPKNPVPIPKANSEPASAPTVPLEGRSVSLPARPAKVTYPAYGETQKQTDFARDRNPPAKPEPVKQVSNR
jgi:hypothetical protein